MKSIFYIVLALCIFLSSGLVAQEKLVPIKKVRVKANQLSARAGADAKFHRLGFFSRDDILNVYGEENGWYKTDCPKDTSFYIYQQFIKVNGSDGEINGERVNARSAASEDSVVLGTFNHKTKVSVLGVTGEWVKIAPPAYAVSYISGDEKFVEVLKGGELVVNRDATVATNNNSNVTVAKHDEHAHDDHGHDDDEVVPYKTVTEITTGSEGLTSDAQAVLQKREEQIRQIEEDARRNAANILKEKDNEYLFKGWVGRLGRVIGRKATHSLYKTENDDLCHLVSNNPDLKLEDYAGKYVGIRGEELGREKRSKVNLIGVTEITVFENNPDKTTLSK